MQDEENSFSSMNLNTLLDPNTFWNLTESTLFPSGSMVASQATDSNNEEDEYATSPQLEMDLQNNEPSSTVSHSATEQRYQIYTYQLAESTDQLPETTQKATSSESTDFEGQFGFKIKHPNEEYKASKGASWTYSSLLEELYVKMNVDCPILIQVIGTPPPGTRIKVTPYYQRPEDSGHIPRRCPNHSSAQHETNRGHSALGHIVRCYLPGTEYVSDQQSGRTSTVLPFLYPEMGSTSSTYIIRFMCRTSCPGGMNRRPIFLLFSLEHNGICLGRQALRVRICACPGRDRHHEESRMEQQTSGLAKPEKSALAQDVKRACKRISSNMSNNSQKQARCQKTYTITVTSKGVYRMLRDMIPILEKHMENKDASDDDDGDDEDDDC